MELDIGRTRLNGRVSDNQRFHFLGLLLDFYLLLRFVAVLDRWRHQPSI